MTSQQQTVPLSWNDQMMQKNVKIIKLDSLTTKPTSKGIIVEHETANNKQKYVRNEKFLTEKPYSTINDLLTNKKEKSFSTLSNYYSQKLNKKLVPIMRTSRQNIDNQLDPPSIYIPSKADVDLRFLTKGTKLDSKKQVDLPSLNRKPTFFGRESTMFDTDQENSNQKYYLVKTDKNVYYNLRKVHAIDYDALKIDLHKEKSILEVPKTRLHKNFTCQKQENSSRFNLLSSKPIIAHRNNYALDRKNKYFENSENLFELRPKNMEKKELDRNQIFNINSSSEAAEVAALQNINTRSLNNQSIISVSDISKTPIKISHYASRTPSRETFKDHSAIQSSLHQVNSEIINNKEQISRSMFSIKSSGANFCLDESLVDESYSAKKPFNKKYKHMEPIKINQENNLT